MSKKDVYIIIVNGILVLIQIRFKENFASEAPLFY